MPPEFDSMMAKIIAHGSTRDQAIARLRRAVADTMVALDEGATNQGFLLELLGRPELRAGEVDTGWLDRLQAAGDVQSVRHADAALVQAAIALCDDATADARAHFYALARRGRPQAEPEVGHVVDLLHRGVAYRFTVCQIGPSRYQVEIDGARIEADRRGADRARAPADASAAQSYRTMTALQDADLLVEVNGVPHRDLARRGRPRAQPRAGRRRRHPGLRRRRGAGRRRRRRHREMKMETSLTAPVAGRVRDVLVGANVSVTAGQAAAADRPARGRGRRRHRRRRPDRVRGERARRGHLRAAAPRVARARLRRAARRGRSACSRRIAAAEPSSSTPSSGCWRSTPTCARSTARTPRTATSRRSWAARRSTCTPSCARSTPSAEGLPARFVATLERAARPLRHRGPGAHRRARGRRLPPVPLPAARRAPPREAVRSILGRHLEREGGGEELRGVLDRLEVALAPREPALAELAREVRWRSMRRAAASSPRARRPTARWRSTSPRSPSAPSPTSASAAWTALVGCPQPLAPLLSRLVGAAGSLVEAMTRRYYRIRELEQVEQRLVEGVPFVLTAYEHDGVRRHVAATLGEPEDLPAALHALATHARTLPARRGAARRPLRARPGARGRGAAAGRRRPAGRGRARRVRARLRRARRRHRASGAPTATPT